MMAKVNERRERLLGVCKHIVAGNVDADAVAAFKSAVIQYADLRHTTPDAVYAGDGEVGVAVRGAWDVIDASETHKRRGDPNYRSVATGAIYPRGDRWYLDVVADPDDIDEHEDGRDDDDDDDDVEKQHHASVVANLLVESGRFPDRPAALHHLLHKPGGRALLASLHKAIKQTKKESTTMNRTQELRDIAKTGGGVVAIAKAFLDEGRSFGIGETEFTQLMTEHAQRMFPDKTPEGAFAKLFCDNGADSVVLRKAHALTKGVYDHADLTPTMVGGPAATHAAVSDTEQSEAYAKLEDMAERMRATSPWLSSEQAFAAVFTDPKNGKLAASAHRRPVATTSFEFPR
jgi:hypothetical protein